MSDVVLQLAGYLISFILRLAIAYLGCLGLARLCRAPRHRFVVWFALLTAAVAGWMAVCLTIARQWLATRFLPAFSPVPGSVAGASRALVVPVSWSHAVRTGGRLFPAAYLLVVLWLAFLAVYKQVALRRSLRYATLPPPGLAHAFRHMCGSMGISGCELLLVPGLRSPATAFWWRPRVLLPESCSSHELSLPLADALRHELVHVTRHDYLWSVLADVAHCLLFFHPVVWYARAQLRIERELACDAAVVGACPDRRADYAESLTRFARLRILGGEELLGIDFVASASLLQRRIRSVLTEPCRRSRWATSLQAATAFLLIMGLAPLWSLSAVTLRFMAPPAPARMVSHRVAALPARAIRRTHAARRTVLPFHAATSWQQVRPVGTAPPLDLGLHSALPTFVAGDRSNGPESDAAAGDGESVPHAESSFVATRQAAWTEAAPHSRNRSTIISAVAARVLAGVSILGIDRDGRTVHGHGR
jgi:beta-lactamase regulating signal transducer with metallopeptidase domain